MAIDFGRTARKIMACLLLAFGLSLTFPGCDYTKYPYNYGSSGRWVSEDPKFVLEYWETPEGPYGLAWNEYLEIDGEIIPVIVDYRACAFSVYVPNANRADCWLFRGRWKIRGNEMIFTISEDHYLDGAYEEIHFTREELEQS